ncbi:MAG TPA: hypothetical protein VKT32_07175 [Chthonomonadaceae bacterium]|nr:hypothetical protein [Chthonomonadaceae bacterium]
MDRRLKNRPAGGRVARRRIEQMNQKVPVEAVALPTETATS